MAKVIFKGDPSTGRFGIRQHSSGHLRACSPCCSRSMEGDEVACKGCHKSWKSMRSGAYQLTGEVMVLPGNDAGLHGLWVWAQAATGLSLNITVSS